jgi:voltage-gated potassium channel
MENDSTDNLLELEKGSVNLWETFILLLSLYVLIELSIEIIIPLDSKTLLVLERIDFVICLFFLGDFFYFLSKADDKWTYFKKRWIDFLSSIPFVGVFRMLRITRIVRFVKLLKLLKLLKGGKGLIPIVRWLLGNKLRNLLVSYILILVIVLFYSSLAFYSFEKDLNPNINEFFDAFWWAFITVTSVGYGDIFPITKIGKVIAMILTLSGMGLFSVVTAELSAKFITYIKEDKR